MRKHIGDYTLFFTGMFPESINHFRLRRNRLENFVDWIKAGKLKAEIETVPLKDVERAWGRADLHGKRIVLVP